MKSDMIRVLSIDDHPLVHDAIAALIGNQPDMLFVGQAGNEHEAFEMYREHLPDVTILDLRLGNKSGIDVLIAIRGEFPNARVIILTMFEGDVDVQRALKAGAAAYLLKSMASKNLVETIRRVYVGKKYVPPELMANVAEHMGEKALTAREMEVLQLIFDGNRNRTIAEQLFITEETVKIHVSHIMEKLSANDRTQAVAIALRRGIIHL